MIKYQVILNGGGNSNHLVCDYYDSLEKAREAYDALVRGDIADPNDSDWEVSPPEKELLKINIDKDGEEEIIDTINYEALTDA